MKLVNNLDFQQRQALNMRLHTLAGSPSSPVEGQTWYNSTGGIKRPYYYNGTVSIPMDGSNAVQSVGVTAPITTTGGLTPTIGLAPLGIDNSYISATAAIALSKLATDPLARANHTGTQVAATISDFGTTVRAVRLDEFAVPTADVSINGHKLTNVAAPTLGTDAANKDYVDASAGGIDWHESVRTASTGNLGLTGLSTIDGVTVLDGDRVLVKDQTDPKGNGIYIAHTGGWTRSADANSGSVLNAGGAVFVEEGSTQANTGWVMTTTGTITIGTSNIVWTQFTGLGEVTAGSGLFKSGNTLHVGAGNGITVNADSVQIDPAYVGQTSLTTLGTIATGTWNASIIAVTYGGTGAADAAGAKTNLGFITRVTAAIGNGSATAPVVNHNLHTREVMVICRRTASPYDVVYPDFEMTDIDNVTVKFDVAPATNEYTVNVFG